MGVPSPKKRQRPDEPVDEAKSVKVGVTEIDLRALKAHFKSVNLRGGAEGSVDFSQGEGERTDGPSKPPTNFPQ